MPMTRDIQDRYVGRLGLFGSIAPAILISGDRGKASSHKPVHDSHFGLKCQEMTVKHATQSIGLRTNYLRLGTLMITLVCILMTGCQFDSFMGDPQSIGRYEATPTMVPILDRIDVIEEGSNLWGQTTSVTAEDLIPSDLSYRLTPGDTVTVEIFELYTPGEWSASTRRIDAGGYFRLPEVGDVPAAGLSPQQFEDAVSRILTEQVIRRPQVNVIVEESSGFQYTVYGFVQNPNQYLLRDPDTRLLDSIAIAGGIPINTKTIYIVRQVSLTDATLPPYLDRTRPESEVTPNKNKEPVDIESIIEGLQDEPSPGVYRQDGEPIVDIDELETPEATTKPETDHKDIMAPLRPRRGSTGSESYRYDEQRGEWVLTEGSSPAGSAGSSSHPQDDASQMVVERVIKIPYDKLSKGDTSFNIVIRPNDLIYVEGPPQGVVYIDGQIARAGVYGLPDDGRITLNRLVAAAGGLSQIAVPERVDLVRIVGDNREAVVSLNLAAIRQRTEPDIWLRPNDHIIIGTNWVATPLAIIRNGFRMTYGFGFLLDRNFGNDVFGPPPASRFTN